MAKSGRVKSKSIVWLGVCFVMFMLAGPRVAMAQTQHVNTGTEITISHCNPCHGNRLDESRRPDLLFKHATHAGGADIPCKTCHIEFPHQPDQITKPIPQVVCFACHGLMHGSQGQLAGKDCSLCHPPDFNLRPSTHTGQWAGRLHKEAADQGFTICLTCHNSKTCEECHKDKGVAAASEKAYVFTPLLMPQTSKGLDLEFEAPITSSKCAPCHGNFYDAYKNKAVIFNHPIHFVKGIKCVACHKTFPHLGGQKEIPNMKSCYSCHGLLHGGQQTTAKRECTLCHPPTFNLYPANHYADWLRNHGKQSLSDKPGCYICHDEKYCNDCHEIEMPHPKDFPAKHKDLFKKPNTASRTCGYCHADKNWCEACHHKQYGYMPDMGQWMKMHVGTAKSEETTTCGKCHKREACPACHLKDVKR